MTEIRPHCRACLAARPDDGPDPCLGWLPGVRFACCGHGFYRAAYVVMDGDPPPPSDGSAGDCPRGDAARAILRDLGGNPPRWLFGLRDVPAAYEAMWPGWKPAHLASPHDSC